MTPLDAIASRLPANAQEIMGRAQPALIRCGTSEKFTFWGGSIK